MFMKIIQQYVTFDQCPKNIIKIDTFSQRMTLIKINFYKLILVEKFPLIEGY